MADERLLDVAGLDELEERVYIALLSRQGMTPADVASQHHLSDRRARTVLDALEQKGLIGRSAMRPLRYVPAPPEAAMEALLRRRRDEIESARQTVGRLSELFREGTSVEHAPGDLVQLVRGHSAVAQRLTQALLTAEREVVALGKAPLATPSDDYIELKLSLLERGVRTRTVYEVAALGVLPEFLARVTPAGEESRVVHELPMRLIIVDREVGLTPVRTDVWDQWLVVSASPLLDALISVFDTAWARSRAVMTAQSDDETSTPSMPATVPVATKQVIVLMAAGLRDKTIGDRLGMNVRTVERHVTRAMELLGARTRFEAGILATRLGWLDAPPSDTPASPRDSHQTATHRWVRRNTA